MLTGQFDVHYVYVMLTGRKLMLTVLASVIICVFVLGDNLQMCLYHSEDTKVYCFEN